MVATDHRPDTPPTTPGAAAEPVADDAAPPTRASTRAGAARRGGRFALVLSLLALAAGGYGGYRSLVQTEQLDAMAQRLESLAPMRAEIMRRLGELEAVRHRQHQALEVLRMQQATLAEQSAAEAAQLRHAQQDLTSAVADVQNHLSRGVDHWRLLQAEHLMVLAQQHLRWAGDAAPAVQALRLAAATLPRSNITELAAVRALLAAEIAALEDTQPADMVGMLGALGALSREVEALPLIGDAAPRHPPAVQQDRGEGSVPDMIRGLFSDLAALVHVERHDEVRTAALSVELRRVTRERARLMLESASLALVREHEDIYLARMEEARTWVNDHFDTGSDAVGTWLARWAALVVTPISTEWPDISASLDALRAIISPVEGG